MSVEWQASEGAPLLDSGVAHVWRISLTHASPSDSDYAILDTDERTRAERYRTDAFRTVYVQTRVALRRILARYMNGPADGFCITRNEHGKPELSGVDSGGLQFNLSHSGPWGLVALTRDAVIGVDVEAINLDADWRAIAKRFFVKDDQEQLFSRPEPEQPETFCRIWTRKEAYIKACGKSIVHGLAGVGEYANAPGNDWTVRTFTVADGYLGSIAAHAEITHTTYLEYTQ